MIKAPISVLDIRKEGLGKGSTSTQVQYKDRKHDLYVLTISEDDHRVILYKHQARLTDRMMTIVHAAYSTLAEAQDKALKLKGRAESGVTLKPFTLEKIRRSRKKTIDFFDVADAIEYHSYTLSSGASWSGHRGCVKVNQKPTTPAALERALNNAVQNLQGSCYDPDCYTVLEV